MPSLLALRREDARAESSQSLKRPSHPKGVGIDVVAAAFLGSPARPQICGRDLLPRSDSSPTRLLQDVLCSAAT